MLRIQFVTAGVKMPESEATGYVCQFRTADSKVTFRLTHQMLSGLKVLALKLHELKTSPETPRVQVDQELSRIDDIFNRVAIRERDLVAA